MSVCIDRKDDHSEKMVEDLLVLVKVAVLRS